MILCIFSKKQTVQRYGDSLYQGPTDVLCIAAVSDEEILSIECAMQYSPRSWFGVPNHLEHFLRNIIHISWVLCLICTS